MQPSVEGQAAPSSGAHARSQRGEGDLRPSAGLRDRERPDWLVRLVFPAAIEFWERDRNVWANDV
eukprot:184594-Prymnesium_polylepis.1